MDNRTSYTRMRIVKFAAAASLLFTLSLTNVHAYSMVSGCLTHKSSYSYNIGKTLFSLTGNTGIDGAMVYTKHEQKVNGYWNQVAYFSNEVAAGGTAIAKQYYSLNFNPQDYQFKVTGYHYRVTGTGWNRYRYIGTTNSSDNSYYNAKCNLQL